MQLIKKPIQTAQQAQVNNYTSGFPFIFLSTNSRLVYQTPNQGEEIGRKEKYLFLKSSKIRSSDLLSFFYEYGAIHAVSKQHSNEIQSHKGN